MGLLAVYKINKERANKTRYGFSITDIDAQ